MFMNLVSRSPTVFSEGKKKLFCALAEVGEKQSFLNMRGVFCSQ
jgi:hypothetical protein